MSSVQNGELYWYSTIFICPEYLATINAHVRMMDKAIPTR